MNTPHTIIVVPHLDCECILGIDLLTILKTKIDFESNETTFTSKDTNIKVTIEHEPEIKAVRQIVTGGDKNLTEEEVETFIENIKTPIEIKEKIKSIIWRHRQLFRKCPGLINCYEHKLILKK